MELLNRHEGLTRQILSRSIEGKGFNLFIDGRYVTKADFGGLDLSDTKFPNPGWVSQAVTEELLENKLTEYSGGIPKVESPFTLQSIRQDDHGATVSLARPGNQSDEAADSNNGDSFELRCKYIVGCDGAHSAVRRFSGLSLSGHTYPQHFVLCDAKLSGEYPRDRVCFILGKQRIMVAIPLEDDFVRIFTERRAENDSDADPDLEGMQDVIDEMFPRMGEHDDRMKRVLSDPIWLAHFRLHCRGVTSYRDGRVFVAGDAAHIHSPQGGQGMNTGIQDAINLGWKLRAVLRDEHNDAFLNSYHDERHSVGQHLLQGTDRMFSWIWSQNRVVVALRNFLLSWLAPWVLSDPDRRGGLMRFLSQLRIKYRQSGIVGTASEFEGPVKGGFRAPNGDLNNDAAGKKTTLLDACSAKQHTVVLFSGAMTAESDHKNRLAEAIQKIRAAPRFRNSELLKLYDGSAEDKLDKESFDDFDDVHGDIHKRYGLQENGGVVVIRPDLYVEYIGPLSSVDECLAQKIRGLRE